MESEMDPLTAKGIDPEKLCADFAKLCKIHAGAKLFLCRVSRGNEKIGKEYVPKLDRYKFVVCNTMRAASAYQALCPEQAVIIIETGPDAPWHAHLLCVRPEAPNDVESRNIEL
jgi:hypothetical protein